MPRDADRAAPRIWKENEISHRPHTPREPSGCADAARFFNSLLVVTGGTYTVLPGDFPIKIAQKLTGNGNRWHELIAANPNKKTGADGNFVTLLPGDVLKLPASWSSAPAPAPIALPSLPPPALQLPTNIPAALSTTTGGTYKVISGDNPSKIAQKLTGNWNRWREIVAANPQKKTGADGNFTSLLPGELLHLPASWSGGARAAHA